MAKEKFGGVGCGMMVKRYRVRLAEEEQQELMALASRGAGGSL